MSEAEEGATIWCIGMYYGLGRVKAITSVYRSNMPQFRRLMARRVGP